jgi:glutathione S-transferase
MVRFDSFEADSQFKKHLRAINPVGKVPVLVDDGFAVWDTLAIAEYLAERFPEKALWPADAKARARARSVCAEMHSGFGALRSHCPMNIEASLPDTGRLIWRDQPGVRADMARCAGCGATCWRRSQRAACCSAASASPTPTSPRCACASNLRPATAGRPGRLCGAGGALPGVKAWIDGALAEHDFLDFEEPYRLGR